MRRLLTAVFAVLMGAGLFAAGVAAAQARSAPPSEVGGVRSTDNARLAAIITSDVGTLGARVVRSQGVAAVTNPGVGRFCIQPTAASGIVVSSVVPTLSVDYSASTASDRSRMVVQFRSSGGGCPGGTLSVYTLSTGGGAKNGLAFTIVVP